MNKYSIPQICELAEKYNKSFEQLIQYQILNETVTHIEVIYTFKEVWSGGKEVDNNTITIDKTQLIPNAIIR